MRDGITRCSRDKTQHPLRSQIIDLVDNAINVIGQLCTSRTHFGIEREQLIRTTRQDMLRRIHRQT